MLLRAALISGLLALAAVLSPASAPAGHNGPLAGQWHLDAVAPDNTTPDSSGHGLTGTAGSNGGGIEETQGRFGNGLLFDTLSFVRVGPSALLEPARVTLAAWVRSDGSPGINRTIMAKGGDAGCTASSYALDTGAAGGLEFYVRGPAGNARFSSPAAATPAIWDAEWHGVAGVYDGTTVRLYVDGQQVGAGAAGPPSIDYARTNRDFVMGQYPACNGFGFGERLDEVQIYGRALTGTEIAALHDPAATSPPTIGPPPGPGGGGGGGGGARPARAAFTPSDSQLRRFEQVRLDALASELPGSRVLEYIWDFTGDGRPDATCGPEAPVLQTDFSRAGSRAVTLSVRDSTGTVTKAAQRLTVARGARAGAAQTRRRLNRALASYESRFLRARAPAVCHSSPQRPSKTDVTALGGPAAGCVSELQIPDTRLAVVGCLEETTYTELPRSERAIVDTSILEYFAGLGILTQGAPGGGAPGKRDECTTCGRAGARAQPAANLVQAALLLRRARQLLRGRARFYVAEKAVRINGLDYTPDRAPGAGQSRIVIVGPGIIGSGPRGLDAFPAIVSSGVSISAPTPELGNLRLRTKARLVLPIETDRERIANIRLNDQVPFAEATSLRGQVTAELRDKSSDLRFQVALPNIFSKPGGGLVTVEVIRTATNSDGMRISGFELKNLRVDLLDTIGVEVVIDYLRYETNPVPILAGKAEVQFLSERVKGEMEVNDGRLRKLHVVYQPGPPGIKVGPGLFVYEVDGGFRDDAEGFRIFGGAGLAAGAALGNGCAPVGVKGGFDFLIDPPPVTLKLTGDLQLACIPFGREEFVIASDGYAHFSAALSNFDLGPVKLSARGQAVFFDGNFTGDLDANAFIELPDPFPNVGVGGQALVSDRGLAMCVQTSVPLYGGVGVGFGLPWNPPPANIVVLLANLDVWAPSCDVGPYRTVSIRDARASQSGPVTVAIPRGEREAALQLVGAGEAPRVTLRDPRGQTYAMPENGALDSERVLAFKVDQTNTTHVALKRPLAGRWTVEPQGGARIEEVRRASVLPKPDVNARVRRRGASWLIDYSAAPRPAQVVRLLEQAPGGTRELGTFAGRRFRVDAGARGSVRQVARRRNGGRLRLTPSDARGSRRAIVAVVEQNGLPRRRLTLARFRAGPPRIGRARSIRARLSRRGQLTISWRRAPGAERHLLGVDLSDGRGLALRPRRGARRVTIKRVASGTRVTVRVLGARVDGARRGRVAKRSFRVR